jgi:hypothetical protein
LIGEGVAIDFVDGHKDEVSAGVVGFMRDILHRVVKDVENLKWHSCWLLEWVEWSGLLGVVYPCVPFWILWRQRCDGMSVEILIALMRVDLMG